MWRRIPLLVLASAMFMIGCHRRTAPEAAVESYAAAVRKNDCTAAWSMLSSETQRSLRYLAEHPAFEQAKTAQELGCDKSRVADWRTDHLRTSTETNGQARVAVKRNKGKDQTVDLVLENGQWRVVQKDVVDLVSARQKFIRRSVR